MIEEYQISDKIKQQVWTISADMGYGHQRAISPFIELSAAGVIINSNSVPDASVKELLLWKEALAFYEFLSRAGNYPLVGKLLQKVLDSLLYIPEIYSRKNYSGSTFQVRNIRRLIDRGLCNALLNKIRQKELPVLTSFYTAAIAADMDGHFKTYCIICDTDVNRVWAAEKAALTGIIYFVPGSRAAQRLVSYGVPEVNILITGFPLPLELLGDEQLTVLRRNLLARLNRLDPEKRFRNLYNPMIQNILGTSLCEMEDNCEPVTITYNVGGAGAQKEIGKDLMIAFADLIRSGKIRLILIAGTRSEIRDYYITLSESLDVPEFSIKIIWASTFIEYYRKFNEVLHFTDILWTKPSELSFYCALGLPIIITPAIGPQEKFNQRWLREIGAGIKQRNPENSAKWLSDLLKEGRLAEAAWNGFIKARKFGTFNILSYLEKGYFQSGNDPLKR